MASRRLPNTGYVAHKPRADGLWPCGVTLPNGKPKRMYGRDKAEAERKVAAALRQINEGRAPESRDITVTPFLTDFIVRRSRTKRGLAVSTVTRYEEHVRLHIAPYLGNRRVTSLTVNDLEGLYDQLREELKLSESTIHRVHSFLNVALKDAVRRGSANHNPCALIDPPADSPRARNDLDLADVTKYLKAAQGDPWESLYIVAAETGFRQSELFSRTEDDVDLDAATVDMPEKVRRVTGRGMVRSGPKTAAGDRTMALGGWAVAALRAQIARNRESGRPNPLRLIWPNRRGGYVEPQNFYRRVWRPFLRRAGIAEDTKFRELTRKVHASVAVAENVDAATLRKRMGHTDAKTTLDHYVRAITEADRQAARRIDRALRKLASGKGQ